MGHFEAADSVWPKACPSAAVPRSNLILVALGRMMDILTGKPELTMIAYAYPKRVAMTSVQFIQYGLVGLSVLLFVAIGVAIYTAIRYLLHLMVQTQRLSEVVVTPILGFTRGSIVVVVLLASLQQAGVQVTSVWAGAISAAAMVAGGFVALSSVLSNLLCTALVLVFMPFRVGDDIEIIEATRGGEGLRGKVVDLNLFYTSIQTASDDSRRSAGVTRVPNTIFFQKTVRRWHRSEVVS